LPYRKVVETIDIGKNDDYEGIEVVNEEIFIIKINGKINGFKISNGSEGKIDCSAKVVKEYEGLSYHTQTRSLFLVTKEKTRIKTIRKLFMLII